MGVLARYELNRSVQDSAGTAHGTATGVNWQRCPLMDRAATDEAIIDGSGARIVAGVQYALETAAAMLCLVATGRQAGHLFGQHDGTSGLAVEQTAAGVRLVVNGTASAEVGLPPAVYRFMAVRYTGTEAHLLIEGDVVATVTGAVTWPAVPVTLGARQDGSAPCNCKAVLLGLFDTAISESWLNYIDRMLASEWSGTEEPPPVQQPDLLVEFEGDNGSQVIEDTSGNGASIGVFGGTAISDAQAVIGGASGYFNGTTACLTLGINHATTGDVTFECWLRPDTAGLVGERRLFCSSGGGGNRGIMRLQDGYLGVWKTNGPSGQAETGQLQVDTWAHIAFVRHGARFLGFVNGQLVLELSGMGSYDDEQIYFSQYRGESINRYSGYADHIRVTKGLARYTKAFTMPSAGENPEISGTTEARQIVATMDPIPQPFNPLGVDPVPGLPPVAVRADQTFYVSDRRYGSGNHGGIDAGIGNLAERQGVLHGFTLDKFGLPVSRRVRCYVKHTGELVRQMWSDKAGAYVFRDLDTRYRYTIMASDYKGEYNAVIADNAAPEVDAW